MNNEKVCGGFHSKCATWYHYTAYQLMQFFADAVLWYMCVLVDVVTTNVGLVFLHVNRLAYSTNAMDNNTCF